MSKLTGFIDNERQIPQIRNVKERLEDYNELYYPFTQKGGNKQAQRCMECGIPFCHSGCPLGNLIPEFNEMVSEENWRGALEILSDTNNFPEFTGRICPAPCEDACTLSINKSPVTIEFIEKTIIEKAFEYGYIKPAIPQERTGKKVAVVGSGPAGLSVAAQLNKIGHWVVVYEKSDRVGGLLTYGIPDFKLEKWVVERRVNIMKREGIVFETNANVGSNVSSDFLMKEFDAIVLCGGSTVPRNIEIKGRELNGVHFAMDFLTQQNKRVAGIKFDEQKLIVTGKNVVVIGGGDTGADCVGTSHRQKANSVTQIELMPKARQIRGKNNPWPQWSKTIRTSTSHKEGGKRQWGILTKEFVEDGNKNLKALKIVDIEWGKLKNGKVSFEEKKGTEREIPCDMALLAMGFLHPEKKGIITDLQLELDPKGNIKTNKYQTNIENVFAAGDMRRGQSLVVWAMSEGREAAKEVDKFLTGDSRLEAKNESLLQLD